MKKLLVLLLCLLTLSACSSKQTMITNPEEVIFSGDKSYTAQNFFDTLKNSYAANVAIADLTDRIAKFEEINLDDINTKVEEYFDGLKETYKDQFDQIMSYYGGEEAFRYTMTSSYTLDALVEKYCDYHLTDLVNEYLPVKAQMVSFTEEEKAIDMIASMNNGMSFADAAKASGLETVANETVYTTSSDIDAQLKDFFKDAPVGLVKEPFVVLTDKTVDGVVETSKTYYVINVISNNSEEFKDEFYKAIGDELKTEDVFNYFFEKYNVEVHDQDVYDALKETYTSIK